jgi:hypothetical protein
MKQKIIIISAILIMVIDQGSLFCQSADLQFRIIAKSGLILRGIPGQTGAALAKIPYWGKVNGYFADPLPDTIEDVTGYWRKVKYNELEGYMFDGFMVEVDSSIEKPKDFRILYEGGFCARMNYDPKLNWYGIYKTAKGDSLIKVNIELRRRNKSDQDAEEVFVSTNLSGQMKSLFLIGSKTELTQKIVNVYPTFEPKFLFPGQTLFVYGPPQKTKNSPWLTLNATGTVKDNRYGANLENYRLLLSDSYHDWKTQDLTDDFRFKGEGGTIELFWFGDIDNDQNVDLIFMSRSTSVVLTTIFLSSKAAHDGFLKKADDWTNWNCY